MKAMFLTKYGGNDSFALKEADMPTFNENEVLVEVKAITISPLEYKIRNGRMKMIARKKLPTKLGSDFSGVIIKTGALINTYKEGDLVFGAVDPFTMEGPYATHVVAREDQIVRKPDTINHHTAASAPIAAMSALQCLRDLGNIQSGNKVMILGAAGAVGHFATQIAAFSGAEVTAVCSPENNDFVKNLGAHVVINYTTQNPFEKMEYYDIIFDAVDKYNFSKVSGSLIKGGVYINTMPNPVNLFRALFNRFTSKKIKPFLLKANQSDLALISDWLEQKKLIANIQKVFYGLEHIPEALEILEKGHVRGKLIVDLST